MRIINLIENTEGRAECVFAHGLSFYAETEKHRLLLDLGPSEETLLNAEKLGVDLKKIDTVILSHGHYDHSGGIMPFSGMNDRAVIYMQESAGEDYYADDGECPGRDRYRYIGIDERIPKLNRTLKIKGDFRIDDELELFTIRQRSHALPFTNKRLLIKKDGGFLRDDFKHEHYLVITVDGKKVLMSGCAHNGMLSILDAFKEKYGKAPDTVVSGFHLMKKTEYAPEEIEEIKRIGYELKDYPTKFFTCHCTGLPAYDILKEIMGEKLNYVHSGEEIKDIF